MLDPASSARLAGQLDRLFLLIGDPAPEILTRRPASGKWSAHENLAHLGRHHEITLERIERILAEDRPALARYRAEDDPRWSEWAGLSPAEVLSRLKTLRSRLNERVRGLSPAELGRTGVHPVFGELSLPLWLELFLLHEAHHLYVILNVVAESPPHPPR